MSDSAQDANIAAAPSAEATPGSTEPTPTGAQPVSEQPVTKIDVPFHENPRFQELVREKNDYKSRIERLEADRDAALAKQNSGSLLADTAKELVDLGIKEEAAQKMAKRFIKTAEGATSARVEHLEKAVEQMKIDAKLKSFADDHSDFKELQPKMHEMYMGLDPQTQAWIANSPDGLSTLYDKAKASNVEVIRKAEYEKGLKDGLTKKQEKQAGSPSSGAATTAPQTQYSDEYISNLSVEEFQKQKEAIYKARGMKNRF